MSTKADMRFLSDTSDHLWRSAAAPPPSSRFPGDYRQVVSRSMTYHIFANDANLLTVHIVPAKLDPALMKEPRTEQGAPRILTARTVRKPIPSMLGLGVSDKENGVPF